MIVYMINLHLQEMVYTNYAIKILNAHLCFRETSHYSVIKEGPKGGYLHGIHHHV